MDDWSNLIFGIHKSDGSIKVKGVQEDVGHRADVAVMGSKNVDVWVVLHSGSCLGRGNVLLEADDSQRVLGRQVCWRFPNGRRMKKGFHGNLCHT